MRRNMEEIGERGKNWGNIGNGLERKKGLSW